MAEVFYFHVQEDRSIKYKLLEPIMQEDKDVATWRFRIPKVLNQIDMSGWSWWFVYVNAKGQEYSELLTLTDDIDEPASYSTADYDIDYGISKFPGSFSFALEAISTEQGGEIDGEWHTKTYKHKVDGTLQGNQAEYAETESDIISALIVEVQRKVNSLVGGATPLPVNLKSLMTDHDKVYLYTGSEDGESTGYWYYYNGSNFVPGGLYGAGVQIDTTLTQSGQAADAKVVGDEISDLKSSLNDHTTFADTVFENGSVNYAPVYTNNAINANTGEISVESPKRTVTPDMYFIPVNCNIYVKTYNVTVYTCNVYCYSESKVFLGRLSSNDILALSILPVISGTKYVRFFVLRKDDGNLTPQDAVSAITFECIYNGRVSVLDQDIAVLQEKTDNIAVNNNLLYGFTLNDGFYDTAQHSTDAYKYFAKVPVTNGKTYIAYPRARKIYIYAKNGTLINYLDQQNITQITADGDGFAYVTYYAVDDLDSALFYEEGAENVYSRDSLALSDKIIQSDKSDTLTGKKWAVLGDSFTAGATNTLIADGRYKGKHYVYPYLIGNRNNMDIVSFFGGGRTLAFPANPDTFVNSVTCPSQSFYYQNIPSDVDYITIYLGINDSHHENSGGGDGEDATGIIPLGTLSDADTSTYYGAWNVVLTWLITNRPFAHIGMIISNGCDREAYRTAQLEIAKKYGVPYIDLNGDARTPTMIRSQNPDIASAVKSAIAIKQAVDYSGGNLHPNDAAHEYESLFIENFLRSI